MKIIAIIALLVFFATCAPGWESCPGDAIQFKGYCEKQRKKEEQERQILLLLLLHPAFGGGLRDNGKTRGENEGGETGTSALKEAP